MGWGFTAPPTHKDLRESGGWLKGEKLCLMEKLHVSIAGCKLPTCWPCTTKQGFVSVLQKPATMGRGCRWGQSPGLKL